MTDQLQQELAELEKGDAPQHRINEVKQLIQQESQALQARSKQPVNETLVDPQKLLERLQNNNQKRTFDFKRQNTILKRLQEIIDKAFELDMRRREEEFRKKTAEDMKRLEELRKEAEQDRQREIRRDQEDAYVESLKREKSERAAK